MAEPTLGQGSRPRLSSRLSRLGPRRSPRLSPGE
jgi:hypothetical protein